LIYVILLWRFLETFIVIYYVCYIFSTSVLWRQRPRHERKKYMLYIFIFYVFFLSDYYYYYYYYYLIWLSKYHVHMNECNVIWWNDVGLLKRHFSYLSVFWEFFFFLFCFVLFVRIYVVYVYLCLLWSWPL